MKQNKQQLTDLLQVFLNREYEYCANRIGEEMTDRILFQGLERLVGNQENKEAIAMLLDQAKNEYMGVIGVLN